MMTVQRGESLETQHNSYSTDITGVASDFSASLIMQVHDELVLEVEKDAVEQVTAKVTEIMSHATKLDVPLLVDAGIGSNWDEAH